LSNGGVKLALRGHQFTAGILSFRVLGNLRAVIRKHPAKWSPARQKRIDMLIMLEISEKTGVSTATLERRWRAHVAGKAGGAYEKEPTNSISNRTAPEQGRSIPAVAEGAQTALGTRQ
jgi:hypothetical protein